MQRTCLLLLMVTNTLFGGCLEGLIDFALQHHPLLCAEREAIEGAHAGRREAEGKLQPALYAKAGGVGQALDQENETHGFGYLELRWNLYRGGLDLAAIDAATLEEKIHCCRAKAVMLQISSAIALAYYEVLYRERLVQLFQKTLNSLTPLLSDSARKEEAGIDTEIDRQEVNHQHCFLSAQKEKAQADLQEAIERLRFEAADSCQELEIDCCGEFLVLHTLPCTKELCCQARSCHPEYQIALLEESYQRAKVKMAPGDLAPEVDFVATFGTAENDVWEKRGNGSRAAIVASLPLYAGGQVASRRAQACSELRRLEQQTRQIENRLTMQVRTAVERIKSNQKQLEGIHCILAEQQEYLVSVRDEYLRGVRSSGEVMSALSFMLEMTRKTYESQRDLSFALVDLCSAIALCNQQGRK